MGDLSSYAYDINKDGKVVGAAKIAPNVQRAFLYSGDTIIDLNSLIDPAEGWILNYAVAINDNDQILADGCNARLNVCQGLLLTAAAEPPVGALPVPGTLALAGLGLAGLGLTRKRREQKQAA